PHRPSGRTAANVDDLGAQSSILPPARPSSSLRETAVRLCLDAGFNPRVIQEAPDSQSISALVAAGMGVTITFDSVAAGYDSRISAVPLNAPNETTRLYLAHRLDHQDAAL